MLSGNQVFGGIGSSGRGNYHFVTTQLDKRHIPKRAGDSLHCQIPFHNKLVAHTSGNFAMTYLDDKNRKASFYPLQTFSKSKEVDFKVYIDTIYVGNANLMEELNLKRRDTSNVKICLKLSFEQIAV